MREILNAIKGLHGVIKEENRQLVQAVRSEAWSQAQDSIIKLQALNDAVDVLEVYADETKRKDERRKTRIAREVARCIGQPLHERPTARAAKVVSDAVNNR